MQGGPQDNNPNQHKNISPFHLSNFSSSLLTPIVTLFIFNIKNNGRRAIIL
jgi:hypothetical protein